MTRAQLEHVIRAAGSITDEKTILVLGSQAIHGSVVDPPEKLLISREADVFPLKAPEKMELINGSIGEITQFQETFGYYAHGIPPDACPLPKGWDKRLQLIKNENTSGVMGLCLSVEDLACSKLAAGRPKDLDFVEQLVVHRIVTLDQIGGLIVDLPPPYRMNALQSHKIIFGRLQAKERAASPYKQNWEVPGLLSRDREHEKDRGDELSR